MIIIGHGRHIASDPHYLHLLLVPNRTVLWTWSRLIDKTAPLWEKP
jgi:hypothetical protein